MSSTFISFQALSFWKMGAKGTTLRGLILPEASRVGKAGFWTGFREGKKYKPHVRVSANNKEGTGLGLKGIGNGTIGGDGFFNIGV
jgi:hypothetical protein